MARPRVPLVKRFWARVRVRSKDECWPWGGPINHSNGYGIISEGGKHGKTMATHIVSYEIHYGPVPPGKVICHSCDNPPCCNPHHLSAGTQSDNIKQMWARGRGPAILGANNGQSKLTEDDVTAIRKDTRGHRPLARVYGVSEATIRGVRNRSTWRHV